MSKNENWEVIPGAGAERLEEIATNMSLWQRDGGDLDDVKARADRLRKPGVEAIAGLISSAMEGGAMVEMLNGQRAVPEELVEPVMLSALCEATQKYLLELKRGPTYFERFGRRTYESHNQRAKVSVKSPGVQVATLRGEPHNGYYTRSNRDAAPGETFEGEILEFHGATELGGYLGLQHGFKAVVLRGLVSSVTLRPRVELEILGKAEKP